MRDSAKNINIWYNNIKELCRIDKNNKYYLSVYENDSKDDTVEKLKNFDFSFLNGFVLKNEVLNTPKFGPTMDELRVKLLSEARNKSIYCEFLKESTHVLSLESDINYDPNSVLNGIINTDHDIISGRSFDINRNCPFYDDWAARLTENDWRWTCFSIPILEKIGTIPVWSTHNCFCLYRSEPIKNFITFGYFNERLNKHDCDSVVICENFRKHGYTNIVLNSSVEVYHSR